MARLIKLVPMVTPILIAAAASAQGLLPEPTTLTSAAELELNPEDIPGHKPGDRDRVPEPAQPKPPVTPVPEAERHGWLLDSNGRPIWDWENLTGDWWGKRTEWEETGFTLNGSYTFNWSSVWDGGVQNRASTRSLFNVNMELDFDKLLGWKGSKFFVDFNSSDDRGKVADSGAFQATSWMDFTKNIDEIGELWFEQKLAGDVVRLKAGKIDAASEFAFTSASLEFLNASAGTSPNILGFPSINTQAVGVLLFVYPTERTYISGGFFDGSTNEGLRTGGRGPADFFSDSRSSSWYFIGEAGVGWDIDSMGHGRVAAGAWHHTGDFVQFDLTIDQGTEGFYAVAEQQLVKDWTGGKDAAADDKGLFLFGQYAWADKNISVIVNHIAVGLTAKGVCGGRPDDSAGLYVTFADTTDDPSAGTNADETVIEAFYKVQLTKWISIQPDIQYVSNPAGRSTIDDAWVGSIQFQVKF